MPWLEKLLLHKEWLCNWVSFFITFEGGEGTGKSTQSKLLSARLTQENKNVVLTREPGGSPGAELIRSLLVTGSADRWAPMSEILLMYAARADHWQNLIQPALKNGKWVICDRFADSSTAYQGYGRGLDLYFINTLYKNTVGTEKPKRTYVFDLDPAIGLERSHRRLEKTQHTAIEGRFESLEIAFHERVRQGFLKIAQQEPTRCKIIDALLPQEEIHQIIWKDLQQLA